MKIATWNVNSLKVRLPHVLDWLATEQPDVLCLQETKLTDENFPADDIRAAGYEVVFSGQKTYNGVATISRSAASDIVTDVTDLDDPQRRILGATIDGVRVLNLYVVNGQEVGSDKFAHKLHWLEQVTDHIRVELKQHPRLVVLGDFNIAGETRVIRDYYERMGVQVVSTITGDGRIVVHDERDGSTPVDLELADVLGDMPQKCFSFERSRPTLEPVTLPDGLTVREALDRVDDGGLSVEEGENMYRLLGAHRGLSEALVELSKQAAAIDWPRLREARF